ncbi:DsbA family protein [Leuconostoc carnosum]|uniref:DsbA family protein n=1 Tax=Leuconostoc carnosum TaxID=1252 RepID=UPI00345C9DC1
MINIYHFANPLSAECLSTEEHLQELSCRLNSPAHLRFIPVLSKQIADSVTADDNDLDSQTTPVDLSQVIYQVVLDFKAAQVEGNKKVRHFLIDLQRSLTVEHKTYSNELVTLIAKKVDLDINDFLHNRLSTEIAQAVNQDQKLAERLLPNCTTAVAIDDSSQNETQLLTNVSIDNLNAALNTYVVTSDVG